VPLGQQQEQLVVQKVPPLQAGHIRERHPRQVMHQREVGVARAHGADGLLRLELEHLDAELRMRAAQLAHRRGNERREGAGERCETQAARAAAQIGQRGLGARERRECALDVGTQRGAGRGGAQRPLRPVDERGPDLALESCQLLGHRGLRVAQHRRGGRDRAEIQDQRERPHPLDVPEQRH
jgi:hypothetical protein